MTTVFRSMLLTVAVALLATVAQAGTFTVAAASDLRFALDEVIAIYRDQHPAQEIQVIYGSSGKMTTQIMNGAPYDLFFSADIAYPRRLQEAGLAATDPAVYAVGRIVVWSNTLDATNLGPADLATDPEIRRVAIAQPSHAPYGLRAKEALEATGAWKAIQPKLVFGENIAHTAQMVESGAADAGIIALSLALFPQLAQHPYFLIDESLHNPLTQGFVVTRYGAEKPEVLAFTRFMGTDDAHAVMERYGFVIPQAQVED